MKKKVLGILIATSLLQSATPAFAGDEEALGTIIGAIAGAAIGSQAGHGKDKTAGIIIGAIAGAAIGNIIGRDLEDGDRRALGDAQRDCFRRDVGQQVDWDGGRYGSRSRARGSFTSTREGYNSRTGEYCREYVSVIYSRGREERNTGVACSRADGSWYESRQQEITYGPRRDDRDRDRDRRDDRRRDDDRWDGRDDRRGRQDDNWRRPRGDQGNYNQGSAQINGITRQTGGQWYRVSLQRPMSLNAVSVRVLRANVRLHEVSVVTQRGQRLSIYELSGTPVLGQNANVQGSLNTNDRVTAIDIRAESFGAYADILVSASSFEGAPVLYSN